MTQKQADNAALLTQKQAARTLPLPIPLIE